MRSLFNRQTIARILVGFVMSVALLAPFMMLPGAGGEMGHVGVATAYAQYSDDTDINPSQACPNGGWFSPEENGCELSLWIARSLFTISGFFATHSGRFLDHMLWFTIQSSTYSDASFIEKGWGVLRDLANIIFILALIWAAVKIMLSKVVPSMVGGKRLIAMVIISALFVNFSLFFSKMIIDASHILAYAFYNQMQVTASLNTSNVYDANSAQTNADDSGAVAVSEGLLAAINPQQLLLEGSTPGGNSVLQTIRDAGPEKSWVPILILYSFMTVVHFVLIGVFISIGLLFLGRTIALMFGMIASPLAFATLATPLSSKPMIGFKNWAGDLTKNAFMVPVFLFFLYLTVLFAGTMFHDIKQNLDGLGLGFGQMMLNTLIPLAMIMGLLMAAKKVAKGMASEIATQVTSGVTKVVGVAAGTALAAGALVATGGTAALASGVGRGAQLLGAAGLNKRTVSKIRGKAGFIAKKAANANIDPRNTALGGMLSGQLAAGTGIGLGAGTAQTWGKMHGTASNKYKNFIKEQQDYETAHLEREKAKAHEDEMKAQAQQDKVRGTTDYKRVEAEAKRNLSAHNSDIAAAKKEWNDKQKEYEEGRARKDAVTRLKQKVDRLERQKKTLEEDLDKGGFYTKGSDEETKYKDHTDKLKKIDQGDTTSGKAGIAQLTLALKQMKELEDKIVTSDEEDRELVSIQSEYGDKNKIKEDIAKLLEEKKKIANTMEKEADKSKKYALLKSLGEGKAAAGTAKDLDRDIRFEKRRVIAENLGLMQSGLSGVGNTIVEAIKGGFSTVAGAGTGALLGSVFPGVGTMAGATVGAAVAAISSTHIKRLMFRSAQAIGADPEDYREALRDSVKANPDK